MSASSEKEMYIGMGEGGQIWWKFYVLMNEKWDN
jgi:hypothetical protein